MWRVISVLAVISLQDGTVPLFIIVLFFPLQHMYERTEFLSSFLLSIEHFVVVQLTTFQLISEYRDW